jgi:hypothetical protein
MLENRAKAISGSVPAVASDTSQKARCPLFKACSALWKEGCEHKDFRLCDLYLHSLPEGKRKQALKHRAAVRYQELKAKEKGLSSVLTVEH